MSIIKLPNIVYPLQHLDKTNEIIDVVNSQLNTSYTETNPALTVQEGVCTWTVTHNLDTEDVGVFVYQGDSEVLADVTVTSENVITVKFNSASNISAGVYSVVVLAKGGLAGSGGVVAVDSELSTTSLNPVQNRVITNYVKPKLDNYIPDGTVIHVKADGTGDYATIKEAVDSLEGKWSNGIVTIQLDAGTHYINNRVNIRLAQSNFKEIVIAGAGASSTIIESQLGTGNNPPIYCSEVGTVRLKDFTLKHSSGTQSTDYRGICAERMSILFVSGLSFIGANLALRALNGATIFASGTFNFTGLNVAIDTNGGAKMVFSGATNNFTNVTTAYTVVNGSVINGWAVTSNYTNVTTKVSQAVGTSTNNGWITGVTV